MNDQSDSHKSLQCAHFVNDESSSYLVAPMCDQGLGSISAVPQVLVAEYSSAVWARSCHAKKVDAELNNACRIVTGQLRPTTLPLLYRTAGIAPPDIVRQTHGSTEKHKQETDLRHPLFDHSYPRARLKSRKSFRTVESVQPDQDASHRLELWNTWDNTTNEAIQPPKEQLPSGRELQRKDWVTLNRARAKDVWWLEQWTGKIKKISVREYTITSKESKRAGEELHFNYLAHGAKNIEANALVTIDGQSTVSRFGSTKNYGKALGKSILFYDAQRSGKLPANNPIPWRGDSNLDDCVPGGWHDAGDHVKFGLPLSSAATILGWSLVQFKDGYEKSGQLDQMYDMMKWVYDYFLLAWKPWKQELNVQVGDGKKDHGFWGRPEDMHMERPCKYVSTKEPGADIAGGTAAAMAAGSVAYKDKDRAYANLLLKRAKSLYSFAKRYRGVFTGGIPFYKSSGDADEMCEAAMWLYKATGNTRYLSDAKQFVDLNLPWYFGWDDKRLSCQAMLYEATKEGKYKTAVENYFRSWFPGGDLKYTPCGQAWRAKWGSNRYAGNSAFMAIMAAEMGIQADKYRKWAVEQINYILGDNKHNGGCFSFEIGYGDKFPQNPHHRGASCPNRPASCSTAQMNAAGPSPQILNGALVGGPDADDGYQDKRKDYIHNEVALDYNAGFHGALAGIAHLEKSGQLPATNNKCPCNEYH
ncbi:endoglucanase [Elysia marginata]|uniref:Endoglucanase n=1 Tax=Elysia marginata TaxID=1093978 RepID=A0AAV4K1K3_9GAST|nr:endoglucanase [Elysia marginata]